MALAKKIVLIIIVSVSILLADGKGQSVYFSGETPYLSQISELLSQENYRLFEDSAKADLVGEMREILQNDTLIVELSVREHGAYRLERIGAFPIAEDEALSAGSAFGVYLIWTVLANAALLTLYFWR
ncbi:MAG TPA: hypothetical protein ENN84_06400 [Candidatus Marinimicrobia bacterium]|nr:hypothetical protein [Candidatus Neomarinimicrobiota bacterium]